MLLKGIKKQIVEQFDKPFLVLNYRDFTELGNRNYIYKLLNDLCEQNILTKIDKKYFVKSEYNNLTYEYENYLVSSLIKKISLEKGEINIVPSFEYVNYLLKITNEYPKNLIFFWSSKNKTIQFGKNKIYLKSIPSQYTCFKSPNLLLIIQFLKGVGFKNFKQVHLDKIIDFCIKNNESLEESFVSLPWWMIEVLKEVMISYRKFHNLPFDEDYMMYLFKEIIMKKRKN